MVISDMEERANLFLRRLINLARSPNTTQVLVFTGDLWETVSQTPRADLSIFGLQAQPDLGFVEEVGQTINASCIFVRDSGDESALA